jgi:hypothetical protein
VTEEPKTENDESLHEFIAILRRIKELLGEAAFPSEEEIDLADAVEQLRQSGDTSSADELAGLCKRADELKAQHQAKPQSGLDTG